jgi:type I restriction enzyme S subunit
VSKEQDISGTGRRRFRPYPQYKDSGVDWLGKIPVDWRIIPLKRICQLAYGDSLSEEERREGDFAVYGSNGPVGIHDRSNTLEPCLVVGRKGSFGKVNYSPNPIFAIDTTFYIDSRHTKADFRWLYYVLTWLRLDSISKDSAIPGLDREDAYACSVPACSFKEQIEIASFLDRKTAKIDAFIAKKERLIELLQEKRTALITQAVTKGLDPNIPMKDSGVESLGKIPAHWEVKMLKRLAIMRAGTAITSKEIESVGEYPVFGGNGIRGYTGSFTHDGAYPLIGRQGALCGCVNFALGKFWASEHAVVVAPNPSVDAIWLTSLLQAMSLNSYSQSAAQPGLAVDTIGVLRAPLPGIIEQRIIAAFLDCETAKIDSLVIKIKEAIDRLKEYRIALISAAVTGKICVLSETSWSFTVTR